MTQRHEVRIRAGDLREVRSAAREVLRVRQDEIVNERLDGKHWLISVLQEASDVVWRRNRVSRFRAA